MNINIIVLSSVSRESIGSMHWYSTDHCSTLRVYSLYVLWCHQLLKITSKYFRPKSHVNQDHGNYERDMPGVSNAIHVSSNGFQCFDGIWIACCDKCKHQVLYKASSHYPSAHATSFKILSFLGPIDSQESIFCILLPPARLWFMSICQEHACAILMSLSPVLPVASTWCQVLYPLIIIIKFHYSQLEYSQVITLFYIRNPTFVTMNSIRNQHITTKFEC